ncbi:MULTISPECIES: FimV/HubP family polar landmark protein [unclassified Pseudomonas]|uniref:FimV/HubP family polar landmark protein n=1 Tax=unclassified Pseudomonas TaxID=196821 RepID=UPI002448C476|nr:MULTISPECIES: FimV/HubP family polar landmark protein [unclassified Pseudomonas]MDG9922864.1 peptigoglycan-binding protein LysM [Pseudomonas sp. GD04045]MDH0036855.1 peptigoglycan-binding protein LysM [Pseudomonas sp. GD04019]
MVRVRKLVLAIAAASALTSGTAHALGLGEIDLQSSLSQPLVAEIELLEVRDLAQTEVIPTLASPEEFNKAGVDRQYFLTDLKFTPIIKPNGKSVIRITSTKPVREPYVNFLVEVLWPNGRLLREYTLLLDPPMYSPSPVVTAAPRLPVAAAPTPRPQTVAPTPRTVTPSAAAPSRPAAPVAPVAKPAATPATAKIDADQYQTTSSDTLWEIAQRSRQSGSVHQAMLAIQDLNPGAFVDGNINRLKSGQVLRLPTDAQVKSRSQSEAIAQVGEQNTAWREGRSVAASSARQLDATKRDSAGAAPAKADAKDSLKLVAADSGKSTAGSDKGKGDSKALNDQLAVTKESLDSSRRESAELKSRMADLQSQLDKAQRLLELKDSQLAKLQADLAQQNKAAATPAQPAAPAVPAAPVTATKPAEQPVEKPVAPPVPTAETKPAAVPPVEKPATTDFNYEETTPKTEPAKPVVEAPATQPAKPAAAPKPVQPAKPAQAVKPAAPVVKEPEPQGMVDQLLANPMLLGAVGGGALLVLLVGLMVLSRRNAMKEAELQNSLAADDDNDAFASDMDLPDDSFAGLGDASGETVVREQAEERVAPQTADALGEADIYIAYGKFTQAAELLHNAINDEPHRSDLRLKLMEVYAELGDRDGFARQEQELREIGGSAGAVDQLKAKYPAMAVAALAAGGAVAASDDLDAFSLDDLTLDEPVAQQPAAASDLDDSFDLSLDDLDVNLDEPSKPAAPVAETTLGDLDLDSGLDFDTPAAPASTASADMDFDLDLSGESTNDSLSLGDDLADFSLDLETDGKPSATAADDDFMLSLDDEPIASSAASGEVDLDMPADFDLSLAEETPSTPADDSFAAQLDEVSAELDQLSSGLADELPASLPEASSTAAGLDVDDDFDFLSGTDETATKLDLARAYIDMGDSEGARDILDEVIAEGSEGQQQEARDLISKLS